MRNPNNIIRKLKTLTYSQLVAEIDSTIDDSHFDALMAQKFLEWVLTSKTFSISEKQDIISALSAKLSTHNDDLFKAKEFIETFTPLSHTLRNEIETLLSGNFENSLFVFSFCLGIYSQDNPNIPSTAKTILFALARKILRNDISANHIQGNIILADSVYFRNHITIQKACHLAILCGVLQEKYDALSFGRERIVSISLNSIKPTMHLQLSDENFELGLFQGAAYSTYLANMRQSEEPGYIQSFYKCKLCSFCTIYGVDKEYKEFAFDLLSRQFSCMNITDRFYFLTGSIPSYILSIYSLIFCEILKLILFSDSTYSILSKNEIRKGMLWGDSISDQDFELCYTLIIEHEEKNLHFLPMDNNSILLGKWMYDNDFSIIEHSKMVALNCSKSSVLGQSANFFGKEVFERITRERLEHFGWKVVKSPVCLKTCKQNTTDIDVLAFKNGIVLVGQLKVANCGRDSYQIWKAKQTLMRAVEQSRISSDIINSTPNLLYSIFKKNYPEIEKAEIREVIPIVITSTNYFLNLASQSNIAVISLDMLIEIMFHAKDTQNDTLIVRSLRNPASLYHFPVSSEKVTSEIDQPEFQITYEEYLEI